METGEGEVMGPVYLSLYSFARSVPPVAEWLPIVLFNRNIGNHSANRRQGGLIRLYFKA